MGDSTKNGFIPKKDYIENDAEALIDLSSIMNDSNKEFWLIQCPKKEQLAQLHGQEIQLKLLSNGTMGSFTNMSGETYELATFASEESDTNVIQSSASNAKIVGKISRRVSLIHYAEPRELEDPRQFYERSYGSSATRSSRQSGLSYVTPSRSSRPKGSLFGTGESSKRSKKRHDNQPVEYRSDYSHDSTGLGLSSGVSSLG
ncbi:hypothetical protein AQUCO_02700309v1 [Aquilegia coerulea]|uniref:Uncharacterized protein n=1 Tax=Aquilegia coerulea TaxID=218851 RepID=A0A2G5D6A1_AQUCA|nr:hypothetical protein AQUCO_02700309v1 [Aquilegia coerulea]PIA39047.1 hypothetical protein AQUCO_02700309v1 [Aquilegia coerulea]PIA39048.1 hypothetical protein AQUCO_02700309v1 [Aquilegia coerulea]PIA39049.1 hypothetical protein AQUCO_02700309v1 [Aquilegia coerulea]